MTTASLPAAAGRGPNESPALRERVSDGWTIGVPLTIEVIRGTDYLSCTVVPEEPLHTG